MPELRWTLLIIGAVFVLALALWEFRRQRQAPRQSSNARTPMGSDRVAPTLDIGADAARLPREPTITLPELHPEPRIEPRLTARSRESTQTPPVVEVDEESFARLTVRGETDVAEARVQDTVAQAFDSHDADTVAMSVDDTEAAASAAAARVADIGHDARDITAQRTPDAGHDARDITAQRTPDAGHDARDITAQRTPDAGHDARDITAQRTPDAGHDARDLTAQRTPDAGHDARDITAQRTPDAGHDARDLTAQRTPDVGHDARNIDVLHRTMDTGHGALDIAAPDRTPSTEQVARNTAPGRGTPGTAFSAVNTAAPADVEDSSPETAVRDIQTSAPTPDGSHSGTATGFVSDADDEVIGPAVVRPAQPAGASAAGPPIVDWPCEDTRKIVALRLVSAPAARFPGRALRQALAAEGFVLGKFDIFHKPGPDDRAVLSAANLTKPGTFALNTIDAQRFGGISLFAVLPGPLPPQETFDELLATARNLNDRLQGALQDERGEPLTPMRSASIRQSLSEQDGSIGAAAAHETETRQ